jgi:hypothetical protein
MSKITVELIDHMGDDLRVTALITNHCSREFPVSWYALNIN